MDNALTFLQNLGVKVLNVKSEPIYDVSSDWIIIALLASVFCSIGLAIYKLGRENGNKQSARIGTIVIIAAFFAIPFTLKFVSTATFDTKVFCVEVNDQTDMSKLLAQFDVIESKNYPFLTLKQSKDSTFKEN